MMDFDSELNSEQLAVVKDGDGPCLVLAGAGSGKTRTITYRVAYLLHGGVRPENILLVTFTNKAARQMTERVEELMGSNARLPWSGTFHHIAYRMLRKYAPLLGYKNNFTILDSEDSRDLFKICIKEEGVDRKERRFPSPRVLQSIVSYARNAELTMEEVLDEHHPKWIDFVDVFKRIASEYAKRKLEANAMDFDDLLVNLCVLLAKSESVRKKYSEQFQYILVDEYQDTNKVQASIIKHMASAHRNVLVVGDDAQSIYSFRAADIENILNFEKDYPRAQVFRLETNYRSTPDILDVANEVIARNQNQYSKHLKSIRERFTKPEVHAFADEQEEAGAIAERILELRDEGVKLDDMAVVFRAAFHSQALEMELVKRDIPYEYRGGVRFFERSHIKDVLAYLRIFHNPDDAVAWSRTLNMQVGIGPASAERVITEVRGRMRMVASETSDAETNIRLRGTQLEEVGSGLSARGRVGWNDLLQIWGLMEQTDGSPSHLIEAVTESKYAEYLENEYSDYRERLQDLEQLAIFASRQPDLSRFLAESSMQESFAQAQVAAEGEEDEEQLVLSTIHQAKGLEWEAVFVIGLSNGKFPSDRSLGSAKEIEEERRLFYVAVTRAKKHLYMSYTLTGGFNSMLQGPSMFLEEIDRDLLHYESLSIMGSSVFSDPSDDVDDITYEPEDEPFSSSPRRSFLKGIEDL